jgi:AbrB family looped-hinge helix DNA binding protein
MSYKDDTDFTKDYAMSQLDPITRRSMDEVANGLPSKSAKMRALDERGYSRSQIAQFLDVRYQFVRNVLVQAATPSKSNAPGFREDQGPGYEITEVKTKIGPGGRIVIPAPFREALHAKEGDEMVLSVEDGVLHVETRAARLRRAQDIASRYLNKEGGSSEDFIAERRREAARE